MNTMSEQPRQSPDINVGMIERELTSLWKAAGEEDEQGGIIRACLMNLLVYVPDDQLAGEVDEIITEVTAEHPSRALLIIADPEAEPFIEAHVSSRCTIPSGMSKQVCCEQVTISAGGSLIGEAPSVVTALLLSDLPVCLWWHAAPRLGDKTFERLVAASDRVIIDSADFTNPHEDMAALAAVLGDDSTRAAFSDLNWARLTPWRSLVAGFYDVAEYRPLLDRLERVLIEYAPPPEDRDAISSRSALLAGWLTSRLGWKLESAARKDGSSVFELRAGERKVSVELVPTSDPAIKPRLIARVTLESAAETAASFKVARSADGSRIETHVAIGEERHIQRVLGYDDRSESALIGRELEILGRDRVYEQAVISAGEMLNAISS
ncbi:MAG: glucose-6-phosphate dehydrogenase assembly protein OpcA [Blastocatellia bacterium]|nr:glucose-6-phosphate dehydrogenase assembly protein OpcA [Blastocatellia bacterium]